MTRQNITIARLKGDPHKCLICFADNGLYLYFTGRVDRTPIGADYYLCEEQITAERAHEIEFKSLDSVLVR